MRPASVLFAVVLAAAVAGCSDAPDASLPGVRTQTEVEDEFRCGPLLVPAGCTIVRVPRVESGCAPEVPGYVRCDATVWWEASSGSVSPDAVLRMLVNGTEVGTCAPRPQAPCALAGNATFSHSFEAPGEQTVWPLALHARLESPTAPEAATAEFSLRLRMAVHTQPPSAADA